MLNTDPHPSRKTERFTEFCRPVWNADNILRKYVDENEIEEVADFASSLVGKGKSPAEAAEATIDLLARATALLKEQLRKPKIVG